MINEYSRLLLRLSGIKLKRVTLFIALTNKTIERSDFEIIHLSFAISHSRGGFNEN
jgi:hypothetical protein